MSFVIDSKVSLPVTEEQQNSFKTWVREKYENYTLYVRALRNDNSIDIYIRSNILTQDMKSIWIESEPYVNVVSDDLTVKRIQLYRSRIIKKVKYMKLKLGEFAYKEEVQEIRRQQRIRREELENRRILYMNMINLAAGEEERMYEYIMNNNKKIEVIYNKKEISEEEAESLMEEDCCICMEKHTMNSVIEGQCGHQIGKCCFQEWAKNSKKHIDCPLCRGKCNHVTEFVVPSTEIVSN